MKNWEEDSVTCRFGSGAVRKVLRSHSVTEPSAVGTGTYTHAAPIFYNARTQSNAGWNVGTRSYRSRFCIDLALPNSGWRLLVRQINEPELVFAAPILHPHDLSLR